MSPRTEPHKSSKKHIPSYLKKELLRWQFPDYPAKEKRNREIKLQTDDKFLDSGDRFYHLPDYSGFDTMSQWAAVSRTFDKNSSHSYELSSKPEPSNEFIKRDDNSVERAPRAENDISIWKDESQTKTEFGRCEIGQDCVCPYPTYDKTYLDILPFVTETILKKIREEKLEKMSLVEEASRKSKPISNSIKVESAKQKKTSSCPHGRKQKKKSRKINSPEPFSKKFVNAVSMTKEFVDGLPVTEFNKLLEKFEMIQEGNIWENECSRNPVPVNCVSSLCDNLGDLDKTEGGHLSPGQSFNLIFSKDDVKYYSKRPPERPSSTRKHFRGNVKNKGVQTHATVNETFRQASQEFESNGEERAKNTISKCCSVCFKMEQNSKLQKEFNLILLEQIKNLLIQFTDMMALFNQIVNTKKLNNVFKAEEVIKKRIIQEFSRYGDPSKVSVTEHNFKASAFLAYVDSVLKNLDPLQNEGHEFPTNNSETIGENVCAFSPGKYNDVVYSSQVGSSQKREKEGRRKSESSVLSEENNRRGKMGSREKNKLQDLKTDWPEGKDCVNTSRGAAGDENAKGRDLNEEEEGGDEAEDDCDKTGMEMRGDAKKFVKGKNIQSVRSEVKMLSEVQDGLTPGKVGGHESNADETDPNEDNLVELSSDGRALEYGGATKRRNPEKSPVKKPVLKKVLRKLFYKKK